MAKPSQKTEQLLGEICSNQSVGFQEIETSHLSGSIDL